MNTAKVILLFVLTKYFSTFIHIIFYFSCILSKLPTTYNSTPTATPSTASGRARGAPSPRLACPSAYSQPDTLAGARKAPQCGGGLASETRISGLFSKGDHSMYQLFRLSYWDVFCIGTTTLKRLLPATYWGILLIQKKQILRFCSVFHRKTCKKCYFTNILVQKRVIN